ncbi:MAG: gliding motility-associated C-terminal domain-containing protein [Flavobacteriales bacterium]|nr:gliding motility-associated C-terminal domain-containing protein [Flavobacteriales bacterium]
MNTSPSIIKYLAMAITVRICLVPCCSHAQVTTEVEWQRCLGGSDAEWGSRIRPTSDGGFICTGFGSSYDGDMLGNHGTDDMFVVKLNADGAVQWKRVLGGSLSEFGFDCMEMADGSYMIVGNSYSTNGDLTTNQGNRDLWVVNLSPNGEIIWQRTYGGSGTELGGTMLGTSDGGFLLQLTTSSNDGDVVGFHDGVGTQDHWLLKIDGSGAVVWNRALGGSGFDAGSKLIETADGGFLVILQTESTDGDITNYHGNTDCCLVKLSQTGNFQWSRCVGGTQRDNGFDILELDNGDIMFLGATASSDVDITLNQGGYDVFLAKLTSTGALLWVRTYGGSVDDDCRSMVRTDDGGFFLAGSSTSNDGDVSGNQGGGDAWLLKVDANGVLDRQRSYGGSMNEWTFLYGMDDGGFLLSGITESNDGNAVGNHGENDLWLVKVAATGDLIWHRCLGGSNVDWGYLQASSSDGGHVAIGYTESNDGDVSGNHGGRDMWVVKLKLTEPTVPSECALFVPSAFSPDNSAKNDAQCLYGTDCITSMTFNIFDRWGNKVFESTDPEACWDGTFNGQALDPAVFVYHLRATLANEEVVEKQGNITLVR